MDNTQLIVSTHIEPVSTNKPIAKKRINPKLVAVCTAIAVIGLFVGLFTPRFAYAGLFNIVDDLTNWGAKFISDTFFKPLVQGMLTLYTAFINMFNLQGMLTTSFKNIIGNGSETGVYTAVKNLCKTTIQPVAQSILALAMLMQVVKISQRMDATATLPALKDLVYLAVYFSIFNFLISNSFEICAAVYGTVNGIIAQIGSPSSIGNVISLADVTFTMGDIFGILLFVIIGTLITLIVLMLAYVVVYLRYIQLYIYAAFSPIPISLMGFEETKQFGINFCKNFVAVCLSGAIIAFGLYVFPYLITSVFQDSTTSAAAGIVLTAATNGVAPASIAFIKLTAMVVCLGFVMMKSGSMAKDILGG